MSNVDPQRGSHGSEQDGPAPVLDAAKEREALAAMAKAHDDYSDAHFITGFARDALPDMLRAARAALATASGTSTLEVEAMLAACLPGGTSCDPQEVADAIRRYLIEQPSLLGNDHPAVPVATQSSGRPVAALENEARDAARYRWLRSLGYAQSHAALHHAEGELDAYVDAAMRGDPLDPREEV